MCLYTRPGCPGLAGISAMSDIDWLADEPAAPSAPTPRAPKPDRPPPPYPAPLGTISPVDAWLVFRTVQDAPEDGGGWGVEHLRVAKGAALNRLKPGEPKDWTHDVPLLRDGENADHAWRRFCREWEFTTPQELAAAMREVARIAGLEWCAAQADRYEEALRK